MTALAVAAGLLTLAAATIRTAAAWHDTRCTRFANTTDQETR